MCTPQHTVLHVYIYMYIVIVYTTHTVMVCLPNGIIPHDLPGQQALVHWVREVSGDVVDGREKPIAEGGHRDTTMHTEHLVCVGEREGGGG